MTLLPFEDQTSKPATGFAEFWIGWPRKVGKRTTIAAWKRACKRAAPEEIIAGRDLYIRNKPAYCDWMHPTTFLNGDRWEDEYDTTAKPSAPEDQSLESAAWKIQYGTGDGFKMAVTREQARACVDAGMVTEEQARAWL